MNSPLIWLHEDALRISHPVFKAAPAQAKAVYVWDDGYFREANYSLKRIVFIYETLCELPVDIIHGDTFDVIREFTPSSVYVPTTHNPFIMSIVTSLKSIATVHMVEDEAFAAIKRPIQFRRFVQYWNKAEKTAFLHDGGVHV
jgi:hypothetical protein